MKPETIPDTLRAEAASFGLKPNELEKFCAQLGRLPSREEIAVCGALWSEHCSYKSSKVHLRRFHTEEPWVWQGPGENAGIVGLTEEWGVAFKMESHNHPSFIEPYQGAATGVGGILRDVFCMGAWPVANMNCLRYGEDEWNGKLLRNTVRGIADYGNSVGVPTVSGDTSFHAGYSKNILVNAFTAGVIHKDAIFRGVLTGTEGGPSAAEKARAKAMDFAMGTTPTPEQRAALFPEGENLLVYFGQATGRDGVHGATMSSAEFSDTGESLKPTVQVGDPFAERRLLEATLALIEERLAVGLQDMGAAGLTSSSVEMAGRSGCGVVVDLAAVPQRAANMQAFEILLSESQERMLCAVEPTKLEAVRARLAHWDVEIAVVGRVNHTGRFVCLFDDVICTSIPVDALVDDIPRYEWPVEPREAYLAARKVISSSAKLPVYAPSLTNPTASPIAKGTAQAERNETRDAPARPILGVAALDAASAASAVKAIDTSLGAFLETNATVLEGLIAHPAFAARFPLTSHYCATVQGNTIAGCGNLQDAAAAVVRLPRAATKAPSSPSARVGIALAAGCEERWVELDPLHGAILTALKVARRIVAVGGTPLGLTDCLNFGSPTNPSVMRQLSDAIDGITRVSKELGIPVVSGNVSLNNQTEGTPIPPTPMLGMVGRVEDVARVRFSRLPSPSGSAPGSGVAGLELHWLAHPTALASATVECGQVWWILAGENRSLPTPDLDAERVLWKGLSTLGDGSRVPLCVPVGHGGALLASLRLAFENDASISFAPEFLSLPARRALAEGQAGFLVALDGAHRARSKEEAARAGLSLTPVGSFAPGVPLDGSRGPVTLLDRLSAAWKGGLAPFFASHAS